MLRRKKKSIKKHAWNDNLCIFTVNYKITSKNGRYIKDFTNYRKGTMYSSPFTTVLFVLQFNDMFYCDNLPHDLYLLSWVLFAQ